MIKVGLGYDIHRLVEGRRLLLGGVELPFEKGEDGHSDGDVLFHAIADAVLGAAGLGDIGSFFPPEDPKWKNADSACLLKTVIQEVYKAGWKLESDKTGIWNVLALLRQIACTAECSDAIA